MEGLRGARRRGARKGGDAPPLGAREALSNRPLHLQRKSSFTVSRGAKAAGEAPARANLSRPPSRSLPPCPRRTAPEGSRRVARAPRATRLARRRLIRRLSSPSHGPPRTPVRRRARTGRRVRGRARAGGGPPRARPPLPRVFHRLERRAAREQAPRAGARIEPRPVRPRGRRRLGLREGRDPRPGVPPRALRARARPRPRPRLGGRERPRRGPVRPLRDPLAARPRRGRRLAARRPRRSARGLSRLPRGRALRASSRPRRGGSASCGCRCRPPSRAFFAAGLVGNPGDLAMALVVPAVLLFATVSDALRPPRMRALAAAGLAACVLGILATEAVAPVTRLHRGSPRLRAPRAAPSRRRARAVCSSSGRSSPSREARGARSRRRPSSDRATSRPPRRSGTSASSRPRR